MARSFYASSSRRSISYSGKIYRNGMAFTSMNLTYYYWYFQSVIPPRICDMIVQYGKAQKKKEVVAITGGQGRDRDLLKQPLNRG